MKKLPFYEASATLVGTIIGAGFLAIPFAVAQIGLLPGILIMVALGFLVSIRHLMLAEITLRTPHTHQMPGYAGIHLGRGVKYFDFVILVLGGLGTMVAYLIGEGEVLAAIFGGSAFKWSLIFSVIGSLFVFFGLKLIKHTELVMTIAIFIITLALGVFAWDKVEVSNFFLLGRGGVDSALWGDSLVFFCFRGNS